ncbi:MAG: glycosyltransferase [Chlamydiia bacterium]|nr:glycosyltransferase [Chlamydiia bacterium]
MCWLRILILFPFFLCASDVSVIVPCYWKHFQFIEELLSAYAVQTQLPKEVVISLSEADKVPPHLLKDLERRNYPFDVRIIKTDQKLYAGQNRNVAAQNARGEILLAQDADDLPHPQRVEILTHMMKKHRTGHIIHQWVPDKDGYRVASNPPPWVEKYDDIDKIPTQLVRNSEDYLKVWDYFHNGHIAIKKRIWERYQWPATRRGQDFEYNAFLMNKRKKVLLLYAPLVIYRQSHSSETL